MARKRAKFEWIADGVDGELVREGLREDRKALKARVRAAEALVARMAKLDAPARARLPLDPDTLDALEVLVGIRSNVAARRQQGFVTGLLRDVDLDALEAAIDKEARR